MTTIPVPPELRLMTLAVILVWLAMAAAVLVGLARAIKAQLKCLQKRRGKL